MEEQSLKNMQAIINELSKKADLVYQFVTIYSSFINTPKDYGVKERFSMLESHTITHVDDHPGTTVTELAKIWNRTKGAISQTITKLEKKGYIYKQVNENNRKIVELYATEQGSELSAIHKSYDAKEIASTMEALLKHCSYEEIDAFYKVLELYISLLTAK